MTPTSVYPAPLPLDEFLAQTASLTARLAAEAVRSDQQRRWLQGEQILADRYLDALPQVLSSPQDALVIIQGELRLTGDANLGFYRKRYPQLALPLDALSNFHQALIALGQEQNTPAVWPGETGPAVPLPEGGGDKSIPSVPGYDLLEKVGQGGMGVVYRARQQALSRLVALKLIRASDLPGPEEEARFLAEAEALAAIEHPNVVRVYEAGRFQNQPFMALEFVSGGSLADHLRQGPLRATEAAKLVEQIARGVQACHERRIVHRDLKPGNVLMGTDGTPKVTDFGLARRVEAESGLTQSGAIMGTPSYMAPEQARGESRRVGPEADVYALGAILYECLTGRPPFVGPVAMDVLLQVVGEEPVAVRALAPKTPRDLETICHKCLQKEPSRRYASAEALGDDLQRLVAGEPIRARPVGPVERVWKWARKRPGLASLLGTLLVGTVAFVVLIKMEQLRTAGERDRALKAEKEAKESLADAARAVDLCFGLARDDPMFQADHFRAVRVKLLENTLPFYQGFTKRDPEDASLGERHWDYLSRVAYITEEIGDKELALRRYQEALEVLQRLKETQPETRDYRAVQARSLYAQGLLQSQLGKYSEAMASFQEGLALLEELLQEHPEVARLQMNFASNWTGLGQLQARMGRSKESLASHDRARIVLESLTKTHPEPRYLLALGDVYSHLASGWKREGKLDEAARYHGQALALRRRLLKEQPGASAYQAAVAETLNNLAILQGQQRQYAEALKNQQEASEILARLVMLYPEMTTFQADLGACYHNMGLLQMDLRQPEKALRNFEQAREIREKLCQTHPQVLQHRAALARTCDRLGTLQQNRGKLTEASQVFIRTIELKEQLRKDQPDVQEHQIDLARIYNNLAVLQRQTRDMKGALKHHQLALGIREQLVGADPENAGYRSGLATSWYNLGVLHLESRNLPKAVQALVRAREEQLELTKRHPKVESYQLALARTRISLAPLYGQMRKPAEALQELEEAIPVVQERLRSSPNNSTVRRLLRNAHWSKAENLDELGRYREALAHWENARLLDPDPVSQDAFRLHRARDLARSGRYYEAMVEAEEVAKSKVFEEGKRCDMACVASLAAAAIANDPARPLAVREKQAEIWARRGLQLLEQAEQAGVFRQRWVLEKLSKDKDLEYLHRREDFQMWLQKQMSSDGGPKK